MSGAPDEPQEAGTLEPTPERLARARREGDFGASGAVGAAAAFLAVVLALPALARALQGASAAALRGAIAHAAEVAPVADAAASARALAWDSLRFAGPAVALAAVVAATGTLLETRFGFAPRRLLPRARPRPALLASAGTAARGLAHAALGLALVAFAVGAVTLSVLHTAGRDALALMAQSGSLALAVLRGGAGLVALVAASEAWRAWRARRARLRMTPRALTEERRAAEGDPEMRAARSRATAAARHEQPLATLTDPHTLCVASDERFALVLAWRGEADDPAPRVVAVGRGARARGLAEDATRLSIAVAVAPGLARALGELPLGAPIPERHYEEVAALLAPLADE